MAAVVAFVGVMALGIFSMARWCNRATAQSGVVMGTQVPKEAIDNLMKNKLLIPGEELLAYYDATMSIDGSEVSFVTTERVVYWKDKRATSMRLAEVSAVEHRAESLIGDIIEVKSDSGQRMKIEVAPLNDGPAFLNVLKDAWANRRPDASVVERAAP